MFSYIAEKFITGKVIALFWYFCFSFIFSLDKKEKDLSPFVQSCLQKYEIFFNSQLNRIAANETESFSWILPPLKSKHILENKELAVILPNSGT